MKKRQRRAAFTLVEMIGYMGVFVLLSALTIPLLGEGLDLCASTARITRAARSSQAALESMCRDMRCAARVELSPVKVSSGPVPVLMHFDDGSAAAYTIADGSFIRVSIPPDGELSEKQKIPGGWLEKPLSGTFADLTVEPVPDARRVYRLRLTARVRRPGSGNKRYDTPVFTTAVQVRKEGDNEQL